MKSIRQIVDDIRSRGADAVKVDYSRDDFIRDVIETPMRYGVRDMPSRTQSKTVVETREATVATVRHSAAYRGHITTTITFMDESGRKESAIVRPGPRWPRPCWPPRIGDIVSVPLNGGPIMKLRPRQSAKGTH
jgi:hypothetical protein